MPRTKPTSAGFTLVEVLFIVPMAMLVLVVIIYAMSTMVGDVLIQRERNMMTYSLQDATDKIENDVKLATSFAQNSNPVSSPQGVNGTATPYQSSSALIIRTLGTTKRPPDATRDLSFSQYPDASRCGSPSQFRNDIIVVTIIYYVQDNTLWRRTVVPNTPACPGLEPWQLNTCAPGTGGTVCRMQDVRIAGDISGMEIRYYDAPGGISSPTANNSTSIATIKLTSSKRVAGRDLTTSTAISAMKLN